MRVNRGPNQPRGNLRIIGLDKKIKEIMAVAKDPSLKGMNRAMAAII